MRIRTKLTIIFLVIALVPLSLLTGLDTYILHRLGRDMALEMRDNLTVMTRERLQASLSHYSDILSLEGLLARARGFGPPHARQGGPGNGPQGSNPGAMGPGAAPGGTHFAGQRPRPTPPPNGRKPISVRVMEEMLSRPEMQDMVTLLMARGPAEGEFTVLTRVARDVESSLWLPGMAIRPFEPQSPEALEGVREAMDRRESGSFRAPYRGRPSLWVYSDFGRGEKAFMIQPLDRVLALSQQTEATILATTGLTLWNTAGLGGAGILMAGLLGFVASRRVTVPLESLSGAARRVSAGDFKARADIPGDDELGQLGRTFDEMVPRLQAQVHMQQALELASEVQQRLLPTTTPKVDGVDIAGLSVPCDETGGDYFDFLETEVLGSGRANVVVGDVTGHGVSAALLMATARGLIRGAGNNGDGMIGRLSRVNDLLCADVGDTGQFMTLFAVELDRREGTARYVRAGHDPGLLYDPATDVMERLEGSPAPLLGILEGFQYQSETRCGLAQGQVLLIGTDGIWESFSPQREMYGKDRLHAILREHHGGSAQEILEAVMASVERFRGGLPAEDDTTLVVVKFTPASGEADSDAAAGRRATDWAEGRGSA